MDLCFSTLGCVFNQLEASLALARRYGMDKIEIRGVNGIVNNSQISDFFPENIPNTLTLFDKYCVYPLVLGTSCTFHDKAGHTAALSEGRASVDIANSIACPYIRVFGNNNDSPKATENVIEGLTKLCDYAESRNVTVLLEVHGDFNTLDSLLPIVRALDGSIFGLIWDIAHTDRKYRQNFAEFYNGLSKYIKHIHIKDHIREPKPGTDPLTLPGDGQIPISEIMRMLIQNGYAGYFSLELERAWHPDLPPVETALDRFIDISSSI